MAETVKTQQGPPKPLPFHLQFVAGGIAGVSEIMVMYPLDGTWRTACWAVVHGIVYDMIVVKTRFQIQVGTGGAEGYTSITDCFRKIIQQEGWVLHCSHLHIELS